MSLFCSCAGILFAILAQILTLASSAFAQTAPGPSRPLITQAISESGLVVLSGNTRPEAKNPCPSRKSYPSVAMMQSR